MRHSMRHRLINNVIKALLLIVPILGAQLSASYARVNAQQLLTRSGYTQLNNRLTQKSGRRTLAGTFVNLTLPDAALREHVGPYLLGTYEQELEPAWQAVEAQDHRLAILRLRAAGCCLWDSSSALRRTQPPMISPTAVSATSPAGSTTSVALLTRNRKTTPKRSTSFRQLTKPSQRREPLMLAPRSSTAADTSVIGPLTCASFSNGCRPSPWRTATPRGRCATPAAAPSSAHRARRRRDRPPRRRSAATSARRCRDTRPA